MTIKINEIQSPHWIKALIEEVVIEAIQPDTFMGPLRYHWWEPGNQGNSFDGWQVVTYPTANEVRGPAAADGCSFVAGMSLDVSKIMKAMSKVDDVWWKMPARSTGYLDGPSIGVSGDFAGRHILLRVYHLPPPNDPPAFFYNPNTGAVQERPA